VSDGPRKKKEKEKEKEKRHWQGVHQEVATREVENIWAQAAQPK
jgi:hypothetical protein